MKSTNESNAREEMERIWSPEFQGHCRCDDCLRTDEPTFYTARSLESRIKVLEAKVEELDRVIEGLPKIIAEVLI